MYPPMHWIKKLPCRIYIISESPLRYETCMWIIPKSIHIFNHNNTNRLVVTYENEMTDSLARKDTDMNIIEPESTHFKNTSKIG